MNKKLIALLLSVIALFALVGCGGADTDTNEDAETSMSEIITDKDAGTVTIKATVNGTFFDQSTMHYIVYSGGSNGDKCMLIAQCDSQDFYNALVEAGGEPWCTTTDQLAKGEFTDGQKIDVTLTWDGQDEPVAMADTLKLKDGSSPKVDLRFSGNQQNNADCGSGCITCLNSCWAGITSNASYGYGAITAGDPSVFLNDKVMPADGTVVSITFTLK